MAALNVNLPGGTGSETQNSVRSSQGMNLTSTIGAAADDIGDVIKVAATGFDTANKMTISEELRGAARIAQDADIYAQASQNPDPRMRPPADIDNKVGRLSKATEAKALGSMPESYYWQLMDTEVRSMRAKYPGYADYIDSEISRITGHIPANKLQQELRQEAQAGRSNVDKQWQNAYDEVRKAGSKELDTYLHAGGDPRGLSVLELNKMFMRANRLKVAADNVKHSYDIRDINDKVDVKDTEKNFLEKMPRIAETDMKQVEKALLAKEGFQGDIYAYAESLINKPGGPTPEDQAKLKTFIGVMNTGLDKTANELLDAPVMRNGEKTTRRALLGSGERIPNMQAMSKKVFSSIQEAVANKDVGALQRAKDSNEALIEGDKAILLQTDYVTRALAVQRNLGGDSAVNAMLQAVPQEDLKRGVKRNLDIFAALVLDPRGGTVKQTGLSLTGAGVEGATKGLATVARSAVLNPSIPVEQKLHAFNKMVAQSGYDFLEDISNPNDRLKALAQFASPQVTEQVAQLDKQSVGAMNKYQEFVKRNVRAIGKQTIDSALAEIQGKSDRVQITLDPVTLRFNTTVDRNFDLKNSTPAERAQVNRNEASAALATRQMETLIHTALPVYKQLYGADGAKRLVEDWKNEFSVDLYNLGGGMKPSEKNNDRLPK